MGTAIPSWVILLFKRKGHPDGCPCCCVDLSCRAVPCLAVPGLHRPTMPRHVFPDQCWPCRTFRVLPCLRRHVMSRRASPRLARPAVPRLACHAVPCVIQPYQAAFCSLRLDSCSAASTASQTFDNCCSDLYRCCIVLNCANASASIRSRNVSSLITSAMER